MGPDLLSGAITGGLGLIGGGIEYGMGTYARHKAEQAARNNIRPVYDTPQSESDLSNLTASQANTGMSDASRTAYMNNAQGGLASTTNAILKGGGDPNAIGNAYSGYQKGLDQMAIYDDSQRMQHLNALAQNYTRQSANADKLYQLNKLDPYKDKAQAIAQQLQAAQQRQTAGLNTMFSGLGSLGQGVASNYNNTLRAQGGTNSQLPANTNYGNPTFNPSDNGSMSNMIDTNSSAGNLYNNAWSSGNSLAFTPNY